MTLTRRDWWCGIAAIVAVLLLHAAVPRYDWRQVNGLAFVRVDRWFGGAERGGWTDQGAWTPVSRAPASAER